MSSRTAAYYRTHPEARAKRQRAQAEINRRPSERRRRDELNKERRRRAIDGQGDPSTNRARNGHGKQARLKRDSVWAAGFCL